MLEKEITVLLIGFLVLLVLGGIITAIVLIILFQSRCPACKKFGLREVQREEIKEEPISKLERQNRYDKNGHISGSRDVRIYGRKITYKVLYRCQDCGNEHTVFKTSEIY